MFNRSLNKIQLIGNLGKDPEIRYMPNGNAVANITLATTESWRNKQSGLNEERTEWHRVVVYGRLAEMCGQFLRKGSKIYAEGKMQTRKWKDSSSGEDRYTTEALITNIESLDTRQSAPQQKPVPSQVAPAYQAVQQTTPSTQQQASTVNEQSIDFDDPPF